MIIFRLNYTWRVAVGPFPGEAGDLGEGRVPQPHSQDHVLELKGLGTTVHPWGSEASRRLDLLAPLLGESILRPRTSGRAFQVTDPLDFWPISREGGGHMTQALAWESLSLWTCLIKSDGFISKILLKAVSVF